MTLCKHRVASTTSYKDISEEETLAQTSAASEITCFVPTANSGGTITNFLDQKCFIRKNAKIAAAAVPTVQKSHLYFWVDIFSGSGKRFFISFTA